MKSRDITTLSKYLSVAIMGILLITLATCTNPLPTVGLPTCEASTSYIDRSSKYMEGKIVGDTVSGGDRWPSNKLEAVILNSQEDLAMVQPHISPQSYELLANTNYQLNFVVVVFDGLHDNSWVQSSSAGYGFCVYDWERTDQQTEISVKLIEQQIVPSIDSSFYYFFQIARAEAWKGEITFKLKQTRYMALYTTIGKTYSVAKYDGIISQTTFNFQ